jgi:hypothetical protein
MDNSKKIIAIESIVIVLLCLFLFNKCKDDHADKKSHTITKTNIERHYFPKYYPLKLDHYIKGDSIKIEIPAIVDTLAVVQNYFKAYTFKDSIRDTNIFVQSQVQVALNRVLKSDIKYKLLRPITNTTVTIETQKENKPRMAFLVGSDFGFSKTQFFNQISPGVLLITKNKQAYGAGYDLLNGTYQAKIYFPLFK